MDGGGKYKPIAHICNHLGINVRISCPHTLAQNGRAEWKHRHIVETWLTLL